ncbi:MAG TPA: hypothetical protein VKZ78_03735 [Sphingobacteriaceae bacterium]|nr:hypothetical protein [Sphingobacteriaceae bacterium]
MRIAPIFKSAPEDRNISDHFLDSKEVSFIDYDPNIALDQLGEAILLTIPLQTGQLDLEIQQVASSFYNYTVSTSDGRQMPANKETKHYRGIIKDDPNSLVAISFWENEVMGLIANDLGNFNFASLWAG